MVPVHRLLPFLLSATLYVSVNASTVPADVDPVTITFYNEVNKIGIGPAPYTQQEQEIVVPEVCKLIPDSNAKGDKGSYMALDGGDWERYLCRLSTTNTCNWAAAAPEKASLHWSFENVQRDKVVYRSYMCQMNGISKLGKP